LANKGSVKHDQRPPRELWGAKDVGKHQALITADRGPAISSAQANRTALLQAVVQLLGTASDPLQCGARLLLIDAIHV
jgi:hypothetical protein